MSGTPKPNQLLCLSLQIWKENLFFIGSDTYQTSMCHTEGQWDAHQKHSPPSPTGTLFTKGPPPEMAEFKSVTRGRVDGCRLSTNLFTNFFNSNLQVLRKTSFKMTDM